jgi:hypothetical protein
MDSNFMVTIILGVISDLKHFIWIRLKSKLKNWAVYWERFADIILKS